MVNSSTEVPALASKDAEFILNVCYATQLTDLHNFFFGRNFFLQNLQITRYIITSDSAQITFLIFNSKAIAVRAGAANWFLWDCLRCTDIPDRNSIFKQAKET